MQYIIKNNRIVIPRSSLSPEETSKVIALGFKLNKEGEYHTADDALRRSMLDIPMPEVKEQPLKKVASLTGGQQETTEKMVNTGKLLNANQMGLGKTYETIMALENLGSELILIVSPKFVRFSWRNELLKWLDITEDDINIIDGKPKERLEAATDLKQYNIINYELLRNAKDPAVKALTKTKWDAVVLDEAHRIKNRKSQQTKGTKRLKAKHKFALTGTPIQNKPNDLWSILQWIDPFLSGQSYWRFVEYFCNVEENFFGVDIKGLTKEEKNIEALHGILGYIMIRREGDNELPERLDIPINLEMTARQKKLYNQVVEEIVVELEDSEEQLFISSALVRLLRLQQTTSNPQLFDEKIKNPKFEFIKELIEDNPHKKFLVFSRFKQTIYALKDFIGNEAITLTGDTEDIDATIKQFKDKQCMLATIGAVGEGVNGLQHYSDSIIFVDKDWSPEVNNQAVGRLLRKGQENKVNVYDLQIKGTIDEKIENLLGLKRKDIKKALILRSNQ